MVTVSAHLVGSTYPECGRWLSFGGRRFLLALWLAADEAIAGTAPRVEHPPRAVVPESDPDRELLVAVLDEYPHSTRFFTELVHLYWSRIWTICQSVLLNQQDAEEATQDTFLKVHRHLLTFRFEARFSTWINRIARNAALTQLKSRRHDLATKTRVTDDPTLLVWWVPGGDAAPGKEPSLMWRALARLSPEDRLLLGMREIEGRSYEEIAEVLQIEPGATRMRASRAREQLRRALARVRQQGGDA